MIYTIDGIQEILIANGLGWIDTLKTADREPGGCFRSDDVSIGLTKSDMIILYARGKQQAITRAFLEETFKDASNLKIKDM